MNPVETLHTEVYPGDLKSLPGSHQLELEVMCLEYMEVPPTYSIDPLDPNDSEEGYTEIELRVISGIHSESGEPLSPEVLEEINSPHCEVYSRLCDQWIHSSWSEPYV